MLLIVINNFWIMRRRKRLLLSIFLTCLFGCLYADNLTVGTVSLVPGETQQLEISLSNTKSYTAFQFDIVLPEGVSVVKAESNELLASLNDNRVSDHQLHAAEIGSNICRVLAFSMTNADISGAGGTIVNLTLKVANDISSEEKTIGLNSALLVEADGTQLYLGDQTINMDVYTGETTSISISGAKQVTYMSDRDLDFTARSDLKAYVATGYDKLTGTIWLTRVKYVPANTGFLLMGEAGDYKIPSSSGASTSYYMNIFKGTIEGTDIQTIEGANTNYYLSNGDAGVGFYKVQSKVSLKPNRAYLSVPSDIPVVGSEGSTETIKVSSAGQVPYYNSESLDFSSLDEQGVKAYTATGYDYNSGTIWLTRVKQVPAETGVLIMAPQGEYPVPTASVASVYANMFRGSTNPSSVRAYETIDGKGYINYYLSAGNSGVGFYRVGSVVQLGANRCYLPILERDANITLTRSAGSGQNQIAFQESDEVIGIPLFRSIDGEEDGTTSIKNLTPTLSKGEGEGEWYTLQGQRVAKPGKGIYIRNGRKVVIK